jgi:hypothetical protein
MMATMNPETANGSLGKSRPIIVLAEYARV